MDHWPGPQDQLYNLQGSGKNENAGPLIQKSLSISSQWQHSTNPRVGPFKHGVLRDRTDLVQPWSQPWRSIIFKLQRRGQPRKVKWPPHDLLLGQWWHKICPLGLVIIYGTPDWLLQGEPDTMGDGSYCYLCNSRHSSARHFSRLPTTLKDQLWHSLLLICYSSQFHCSLQSSLWFIETGHRT